MKTNLLKRFLVFAGIACVTVQNFSAQNLMYMGQSERGGVYNDNTFPQSVLLKKAWSYKTNGRIFSTPASKENLLYIGSDDSCMYALNSDGSLKWKVKTNGKIRSTAAIKDSVLYFNNYGGNIYALNTKTGEEIWKYTTGGEAYFAALGVNGNTPHDSMLIDPWDMYQSSPVYADSILYVGAGKNMYALNMKNGDLVWKYETPDVIHSSPALSKGKLYFGCWDSKVYALDAITGSKIWDYQTGVDPQNHLMAGIQSSPAVSDTFVFVGSRDGYVYGLHTESGKVLWKTGFSGSWMPSSFSISNDTVYMGSSDAMSFFALNKQDGKIIYSVKLPCYAFPIPAYANGTVFIGSGNGSMYCIDTKNQKIKARFDTDAHIKDPLKVLKEDGSLDLSKFPNTPEYQENVRWMDIMYSTGSIFGSPVIMNNAIYFGSSDSCFYAIHDAGGNKPQLEVSTFSIDYNAIAGDVMIDTFFSISNTSLIKDTFMISNNGSVTKLFKAIKFDTSIVVLLPGESIKLGLKGIVNSLKPTSLTAKYLISSKTNPYVNAALSVNIKVLSELKTNTEAKIKDAYPNPFHESATIDYNLTNNGNVKICILSNTGEIIKTYESKNSSSGNYSFVWDGYGNSGKPVKPGVYFCQIIIGEYSTCKKLVKK